MNDTMQKLIGTRIFKALLVVAIIFGLFSTTACSHSTQGAQPTNFGSEDTDIALATEALTESVETSNPDLPDNFQKLLTQEEYKSPGRFNSSSNGFWGYESQFLKVMKEFDLNTLEEDDVKVGFTDDNEYYFVILVHNTTKIEQSGVEIVMEIPTSELGKYASSEDVVAWIYWFENGRKEFTIDSISLCREGSETEYIKIADDAQFTIISPDGSSQTKPATPMEDIDHPNIRNLYNVELDTMKPDEWCLVILPFTVQGKKFNSGSGGSFEEMDWSDESQILKWYDCDEPFGELTSDELIFVRNHVYNFKILARNTTGSYQENVTLGLAIPTCLEPGLKYSASATLSWSDSDQKAISSDIDLSTEQPLMIQSMGTSTGAFDFLITDQNGERYGIVPSSVLEMSDGQYLTLDLGEMKANDYYFISTSFTVVTP